MSRFRSPAIVCGYPQLDPSAVLTAIAINHGIMAQAHTDIQLSTYVYNKTYIFGVASQ